MSMSFGIVGNCQARGFARSLELLVPGCRTFVLHLGRISSESSEERKQGWLATLSDADIVFTLPLEDGTYGEFEPDKLELTCRKVVRFPYIAFTGYQPDCIYIRPDGRDVQGPMGPYHSALVAGAFLEGLSPERICKLFNSYVFAALGYFEQFETVAAGFVKGAQRRGYDLAALIDGPPFMHTINHPAIAVIHAIAIQALAKAGVPIDESLKPIMPEDELAGMMMWPVYPEIARAIGRTDGDYVFFHNELGTRLLPDFVAASCATFAGIGTPFTAPAIERVRRFLQLELVGAGAAG